MSLPKKLAYAQDRLDEAEGLMQLHAEEVVAALTSERSYRGNYTGSLLQRYVEADRAASNAETMFFNYETDFEQMLEKDKEPGEVVEDYDIPPNLQQYKAAFRTASQVSQRRQTLENQFKAFSRIMEQNGMGDLSEQMREQHPWYDQPEEALGFQTAAEI
jgi:tRNA(Ile2) C34 agmatinyltransferase TiaS